MARLEEIIAVRRSVRKYLDKPVEPEKLEALAESAKLAVSAYGLKGIRFVFITDPKVRQQFAKAAFSGLMGKANPWLRVTKAPAFIAVTGQAGPNEVDADRAFYLADGAMAMEAVVLSATELGFGTCWVGAFGENSLTRLLKLPKGVRLVAVSPLGYSPKGDLRLDWDTVVHHAVSKRRKPLSDILVLDGERS